MGLPEMLHLSGMWKGVPWSQGIAVLAARETRGTLFPGGAVGSRGVPRGCGEASLQETALGPCGLASWAGDAPARCPHAERRSGVREPASGYHV